METGVIISTATYEEIKQGFPAGGWSSTDFLKWYTDIFMSKDPLQKKSLQDMANTFISRFTHGSEVNQKCVWEEHN